MNKVMDYKEKYEAALERMKNVVVVPENEAALQTMKEAIFPELSESEDERIRKELIDILKKSYDFGGFTLNNKKDLNRYLAYLEKQNAPLTPEEKMNHPLYLEGFDVGRQVGEVVAKPAEWSEEDKTNGWTGVDLERYISCLQRLGTGNPQQPETINSKWFKEHCRPQPKQEWSEEEIGHLYTLARYIKSNGYEDDGEFLGGVANKLKSLRPQPHWKPREEQMEALKDLMGFCVAGSETMRYGESLYNELKQLI